MKFFQFLLLLFPLISFAQRDVIIDERHDGFKIVHRYTENDTLELIYFPNGKLFSAKKAFPGSEIYSYKRYYDNGKLMWERQMFKDQAEGRSIFFDAKGKRICSIDYSKGNPVDTIAHTTKQCVVLGNYSYWSRVYGGAQNEDGSSNIQETSGPAAFIRMKLIAQPVPTDKSTWKIIEMFTDAKGDFMTVLPTEKKEFGLFPAYFDLNLIESGLFFPKDEFHESSNTAWSLSQIVSIDWNIPFIFTELKSSSVGYAP
jgi:hypothetical protein